MVVSAVGVSAEEGPDPAATPPAGSETPQGPKRVTGASLVLDVVESGAKIGVPTGTNQVLGTALGALPPEITSNPAVAQAVNQAHGGILAGSDVLVEVVQSVGGATRAAIEPLAAANALLNIPLAGAASVIEWGGQIVEAYVPGLTPTATQVAGMVSSFEEG